MRCLMLPRLYEVLVGNFCTSPASAIDSNRDSNGSKLAWLAHSWIYVANLCWEDKQPLRKRVSVRPCDDGT